MSIFFTSDTHFTHSNILLFCNRPWLQKGDAFDDAIYGKTKFINSEIAKLRTLEMDEALITNWNNKVRPQDEVYHLGDVCFSREENKVKEILNRLNGKIYLLRGNHDGEVTKLYPERFEWIRSVHMVKAQKKRIVCGHYKSVVWQDSHKGSIQLFGHSHGALKNNNQQMDVGVDADNDYAPLALEEVIEKLETFEPYNIEHDLKRNNRGKY